MRTGREADRYERLNETHRRVAEEEEKRRLAEQDQARSASWQPEPEPRRPGAQPIQDPQEREPEAEPESPEARFAAREKELEERVQSGRISRSEMIYQLRRFDNELTSEMEHAGAPHPQPEPDSAEHREAERTPEPEPSGQTASQRAEGVGDQALARTRDDPSQQVPETKIEREVEAAEYEIVSRGEMTEARAARLARLQGIDRTIEREHRENEGSGLEQGHDSGDRSR